MKLGNFIFLEVIMRIFTLLILLFASQGTFATENEGTVYIFTNKGNEYLKIGMTSRDPEIRRKELSSATGVATEFEIYFAKKVDNYKEVEKELHEKFAEFRVNPKREFFDIEPETAYKALNKYKGLATVPLEDKDKDKERRANFSFSELGVEIGEELKYKEDKRKGAKVVNDKLVEYKDNMYSLSGLTVDILGRKDSSGIQALKYWLYKDELLSDIREEQDKK